MGRRLAELAEQAAQDDAGTTTERMQSLDERFTAALAYEAESASAGGRPGVRENITQHRVKPREYVAE